MENDTSKPDFYDLNELIINLENIYKTNSGELNWPKALYTLALEIKSLKDSTNLESEMVYLNLLQLKEHLPKFKEEIRDEVKRSVFAIQSSIDELIRFRAFLRGFLDFMKIKDEETF